MRIILILILAFAFNPAYAVKKQKKMPEVSQSAKRLSDYQFQAVPLNELTRLVFANILKTAYIADDDFINDKRRVTLSIPRAEGQTVQAILYDLLTQYGYVAEIKGDYTNIYKKPAEAEKKPTEATKSIYIYEPKHRSVDYLSQIVRPFFENVTFSFRANQATAKINVLTGEGGEQGKMPTGNTETMRQLVFFATEKEAKQINKLFKDLDTPAGQVFVKANVYEVTTKQNEGSAFSLVLSLLNSKLEISTGSLLTGSDFIKFKSGDVQTVFSMLDKDNRFNAVSTPSLRVADSMTAKLSIGSETPVLGAFTTDSNGKTTQSVEYKPSGIILNLTPQIRPEEIQIQINQQISNFIPTTNGVNQSPTLIKREINTNIVLNSGDVVVLGGLTETKDTQEKAGFSFLPSFFSSKAKENTKTEIIIILQVIKQ